MLDMQPGGGCMQEDTESSGDERGGAELLAASSLSLEEFTRLQDELMALKMYHEELLGEKRWLQSREVEKVSQAPNANAWPNAAALTRSLSTQVKAAGLFFALLLEGPVCVPACGCGECGCGSGCGECCGK
ncbi:unnamed protein product [Symbiodinium microadriaticum]|nr:unnamed protein product [Symbiodinium microadriaticum]CAE7948611.1 unnamed protein product [Symbiodinium sp. KB8]